MNTVLSSIVIPIHCIKRYKSIKLETNEALDIGLNALSTHNLSVR